jgi:hypothetical protein
VLSAAEPDELLSVNDVARSWGTGIQAVLNVIQSGQLATLDRGVLIGEGRYDVPLIRRSWVESLQQASPGFERSLSPEPGDIIHAALQPALDFHHALCVGDADEIYRCSSLASRHNRSPEELLAAWLAVGRHLVRDKAGIGSTIYDLAPLSAVGARIFAYTPIIPRALQQPTPGDLVDVLPLVKEADDWRVDLPLFDQRAQWIHTLNESPPEDSVSSEPGVSSSSESCS